MATDLIAGVAGFIASRVAGMLLDAGNQVVGVDSMNTAYDLRLKEWRLAQLAPAAGFRFHHLDISDREGVARVFANSDYDAVFNLAARAGVRYSVNNPWAYIETNVVGTLNLLEGCRARRVPKFVLASTSSLYGKDNPVPYREDQPTDNPLSPYAASKKAAEALCATYHHLHGIDVSVLRYFTVYGPAGRPDMSPFRFVQRISEGRPITVFGDGSQSRDFTYVDDIARGTIAAARPLGHEIINLGSDRPLQLMEAINTIEAMVGRRAEIEFLPHHPADMQDTWADVSKAGNLLGWKAHTGFQEGIQNLARWYAENRSWAKEVSTTD